MGQSSNVRQMKRLIVITCSLFLTFASVASAWATCRQVSFTADHHRSSSVAADVHDHESGSHHERSDEAAIHCPTLGPFLLTATFAATNDHRAQRLTHTAVTPLYSQPDMRQRYRSLHGPPGCANPNSTPAYLLLSVLRI
jgi:hypothetical protein